MQGDGKSRWQFDSASARGLESYASSFPEHVAPAELEDLQKQLKRVQRRFWATGEAALLVIFQGLDTSGKDGCIRAVGGGMDPMGFRAIGFGVPSPQERAHDFLWRAQPHLPALGQVTLMNRSYYEAVLAERVLADDNPHSGCNWAARYQSIRDFEAHLTRSGTRVLKLWLHVGRQAQVKRLKQRLTDPEKHWKFHPADIDSWRHRDRYLDYATEAISNTHTDQVPWHIFPADDKKRCRRVVCTLVLDVMEAETGPFPKADPAVLQCYLNELERE